MVAWVGTTCFASCPLLSYAILAAVAEVTAAAIAGACKTTLSPGGMMERIGQKAGKRPHNGFVERLGIKQESEVGLPERRLLH